MTEVHIAIPIKRDENGMPVSYCGLSFGVPLTFAIESYTLELGERHCKECWEALCKAKGLK